uniref:T9SS type A sorting domain-containing protein n=1 Tax=candidate division WOR-3 bacterium TaxID=2052148 RepID=A0A7C4TCB6_UNCW3
MKSFFKTNVSILFFINFLFCEAIKVATYNILNFPGNYGIQRLDDYRIVIDFLKPDVLVVQEMQNQYGVDLFLDSVLNYKENSFRSVEFHDGPDTDNALFYRTSKIEFLDARYIPTGNRDIGQYHLRLKESLKDFYIFSVHFKADAGPENEMLRLQEATILRNHLDSIGGEKEILVMGDFNFYYDEPAYKKLVDSTTTETGRLCDPLSASGDWHDNHSFSYLHTQSTRTEELPDGGAGGGLDDRFDIILCSPSLLDTIGLFLHRESYTVFGNDANHFNKSINSGINMSVPDMVADALYYASDHLPVYVQILDRSGGTGTIKPLAICPNPMQDEARIVFPFYEDFVKGKVTITNIYGQQILETETTNPLGTTIRNKNMGTGIYFVHLEIETLYGKKYHRAKMAVVGSTL